MTYADGSELIRSDLKEGGRVLVRIESPNADDFFHSVDAWLPDYLFENVNGFSDQDLDEWNAELHRLAPAILGLAMEEAGLYAEAV
ncbi:hypothetical protein QJ043_07630 [Olsenella sp. YH-ols2217]|uniref:Uncharacterized protein n=2 Tax=Kribbibacterium absianum TaxID=3044210 RepID=A0ABT6ZLM5_9ACTN|nr:hypothetical protein [Olsenella sp. YH-ols2217]MDJ1129946.1 hypothetical protein [Olsenella sp. YH-ols2217]